jgi:tRNA(fMet)-specific endonuclease VapC
VKYVLDTNAVSAMMAGHHEFLERLRATERADIGVPQPVLAELEYGLARMPASRRRERLRTVLDAIRAELLRVQWTDEVTAHFAEVKTALERSGKIIEDFDIAIAAHALAEDAILVTADRAHMPRIRGLRIEDWTRD